MIDSAQSRRGVAWWRSATAGTWVLVGLATLAAACGGKLSSDDNNDDVAPSCDEGYEPIPVEGYVAKAKMLLTGLPVTNDDLLAVKTDPAAFRDLLRQWIATEEGQAKLRGFFTVAFQQGDDVGEDFGSIFQGINSDSFQLAGSGPGGSVKFSAFAGQNLKESFARTAVYYLQNNLSFADLMQTDTFMMTSAMALVMGHNDAVSRDNKGKFVATPGRTYPTLKFVRNQSISVEDSINPASANFWKFSTDDYAGWWPDCVPGNEITITNATEVKQLQWATGNLLGRMSTIAAADMVECASGQTTPTSAPPRIGIAPFSDWKMTKIVQSNTNYLGVEAMTAFRSGQPLVFRTPRVGFYTTPAFLALWQTNDANSFRVSANQSLIVGIGTAFAANENLNLTPAEVEALDAAHVDPSSPCFGCHQSLDPMRQIFLSNFNVFNSIQTDEEQQANAAHFAFGGSNEPLLTLADLGRVLGSNHNFAESWIQKLCYFANSRACPTDSQQFKNLALSFETGGFNFGEMLIDLFSSPLITGTSCIADESGEPVGTGDLASISRRDHFCAALSNRMGITDICGLRTDGINRPFNYQFVNLVRSFSTDAFPRGSQDPLTVSEPGMLPHIMQDNFCKLIALDSRVVGTGAVFDSSTPTETIDALVTTFMGLPTEDSRHAGAIQLLTEHLQTARETANERTSMQSTFMVACMSPSLVGVGL